MKLKSNIVVQINAVCDSGSTGKICGIISDLLDKKGVENYILFSHGNSKRRNAVKYTNRLFSLFSSLVSHFFGNYGFEGSVSTLLLIRKLKQIQPTVVHLHNIHSHACNLRMLFKYLKKNNIRVIWTLHDCWTFTGYCAYFSFIGCSKWKSGCYSCPQRKKYSWFFDFSKRNYKKKLHSLEGVNITIVTPSKWLEGLVKDSFLKNLDITVINNGIDTGLFKPMLSKPQHKKVVLGVAYIFNERKGVKDFNKLADLLPKEYQIILVGKLDKNQYLNPKITNIERTNNQQDLSIMYSSASVFVNPTYEDNYPTTNLEALSCGTPVVTYNTGGSPEPINEKVGRVVKQGDTHALAYAIREICEGKPFEKECFLELRDDFDSLKNFYKYIDLYFRE